MKGISRLFTRADVRRWVLGAVMAFGLGLLTAPLAAQTGTVEGRITRASNGRAIAGAQVSVIGTNLGTTTGEDGRYVLLNVPTGQMQVRVAAIGFTIGTVQLNVQAGTVNTADAALSASVLRLDEVVVTGTAGQARKREIGNSIAQINLADVADPPQNVDQLLQARAPGLQVMQATGMAGSGAQIRLRGAVSVSQSNQPIIYIDGVRVKSDGFRRNRPPVGFTGRGGNVQASPLNDINPDDIERVEVLKGAAASTLYGTEASAGVIQIFTKKGNRGAPRYSVQIDQGFAHLQPFGTDENPYLNLKPCTTGSSCDPTGPDGRQRNTSDIAVGKCWDADPDPNCSWVRNAHRQKYSGSIGGGTGGFTYFVSGNFDNNDGVLPNDNEKKLATRGNFSFDVSDAIRVDWNTSYTNNRIENTAAGNNAHGLTLNVFRSERNYLGSGFPGDAQTSGVRDLLNQDITTEIDRLITGATVNYTPFTWFSNRITIGYDFAEQNNRNLRPFGFRRAPTGILSDEQVKFTTLTADYAGNINFDWADNIRNTFSFGGQSVTDEFNRTTAYGEDFPGPGVPTVTNAGLTLGFESRQRVVNAGFFVQNLIGISDKYFLTGGLRVDGNSAFGEDLGLEVYPKASLSYVISDEDFFPTSLGQWKLRGAYGFSGRAPGAFSSIRVWNALSSGGSPGFSPSNVGNSELGPEKTREIELGFDAALLDSRLSAEFTWYQQKTTDALFNVRQVPSDGFGGSQLANVGAIRNQGIELALNATVIDQPDFGLDLGANIYTNKSLVLDLGDAVPFGAGGGWIEEGFPVFAATGIEIRNENAIAEPDTACMPATSCASNGEFVFGPQEPTMVFTPSMTLRFPKGIRLSARGELQTGAWIEDGAAQAGLSRSVRWPTCTRAHGILDNGGAVTELTARERLECVPADYEGDVLWFKQDFFKLRDVTLTIPVDFLIPQSQSAFLRLTAQNWVRWFNSDLRMFDPEIANRDTVDDQTRGTTEHIPPPAVFTASLRVVF